jgi:hypothetical protein
VSTDVGMDLAALLAVAAGTWWSCGGSPETVTAPAAVSSAGEDSGGVTASAAAKVTICQNGKTLQVAQNALGALLANGATLGACTAGACPCFTKATIASVAATCPPAREPSGICGQKYSIELRCDSGGVSLEIFEAVVGTNQCSTTTWDTSTGAEISTPPVPVGSAEFEACRRAIVSSPYYPSTCPK